MGEKETTLLIVSVFIAILVLCIGFVIILLIHRTRKLTHIKETILLNEKHTEELLSAQLDAQQQTMQYIGTEIHDNVGQKLTLASLYIKQLLVRNTADEGIKAEAIGTIIDESLSELRQLSKTLTNPQSANADLVFLLNEEAERINKSGICHISISGDETTALLSPHKKNITFRLLQEFIQNSLKHSGCRKIIINIKTESDKIIIYAMDDGKGFDLDSKSDGIGLQNMRYRSEQINAAYKLTSEKEKGTQLFLQLPL